MLRCVPINDPNTNIDTLKRCKIKKQLGKQVKFNLFSDLDMAK